VTESDGKLQTKRALGGLATALARVWDRPHTLWVGWSGLGRSFSMAEFEGLQLDKLALINLESSLYKRYYDVFANGSLWPVLHGFEPRSLYTEEDWEAALAVTERFALCLDRVAGPEDIIWVHDFHLALLPQLIRQHGLRNKVGFFLHIPFPEPDQFRTLPDHKQIAQSLLRANVVGFQTEGDASRFRKYVAEEGLERGGARIAAFPIGIDYDLYSAGASQPGARPYVDAIRERYRDKTLMFSASRLDYTKGILQQLKAADELLAVEHRRDLIYKLVVAPSREDLSEYQKLKGEAAALAEAINLRHGDADWQPIEYEYRAYDVDELSAWYDRADIMVVTPLVDGMNLVAKEYVAAHSGAGVLVLGQRAGAAGQMPEAVIVDPTDAPDMVKGLQQALEMPATERQERMEALRRGVKHYDVKNWADTFLGELQR
jgi:trehalose 6-phosphate synthase/phosphatase